MTFSHITRRVHLYLGLALLPWLFMYGVSSLPFAHNQFFNRRDLAKGLPGWTRRSERPLERPVPESAEALRSFGAVLLTESGIEGTNFGAYRQSPTELHVYSYSFWKSTRLTYFIDQRRVVVEDRRFRWDQFLTGMHARGGFEQEGFLQNSWSVVVDLVCLGILTWIASGLYMWWALPGQRRWGWLAIAAGTAAFAVFTVRL